MSINKEDGTVSKDTKSDLVSNIEFTADYFSRSVELFRDDRGFMVQLLALIEEDLPTEVKQSLTWLFLDELDELSEARDSSVSLQKKCTLLYLLACLSKNDAEISRQLLEQVTVPLLAKVTFATRFPIQEKYFACLYLGLLA